MGSSRPTRPIAGLDGVTFHVLRHTFASILIDQGHDVVFVSRKLGHANPAIAPNQLQADYGALLRSARPREQPS